MSEPDQDRDPQVSPATSPVDEIRTALDTIRYGAILLTVHDGRVVQLDITEKRRFAA
jgi:hypothetical protein